MESAKSFVHRYFEPLIVLALVVGTGMTVLLVMNKLAFLNFFYLPTLLASYSLGRGKGILTGTLAILMVGLYALIDPSLFEAGPLEGSLLNITLWGCFLLLTAFVVGTLYDVKERAMSELRQAYEGIVQILAKFIDAVDRDTKEHSVRVSELAVQIGRQLGLPGRELETLRVAGLLHDVGKVDISMDVLRKAAELTDDEWEHVRTHTDKASALLSPMGGLLKDIVPLVTYHHECYDGSGYHRKAGEEIPLGARILSVADAYDSMISDRPYRTGRTADEAVREIERCSGTQFDPLVATAFGLVVRRRDVAYA